MPGLLSFLGYSGSPPPAQDVKSAVRALPANWYSSLEMYELERRAIFSRKWLLCTHKIRLAEPGQWMKFDVAGFSFILSRDRKGTINGFHNICRHRAFPVVHADKGCSKIFQCKYHGWSYGLDGKLAKAPGYQDLTNFERESNRLFPVHIRVDRNGFVWVNLDGKETPEVAWEDDFLNIDNLEKFKQFNFDDYVFDHEWQMDGSWNWKILADNYNECYHCATAHPDISAVANLQSYSVECRGGAIIHDPATSDAQRAAGLVVAATYHFPNCSTNVTPHFFMIQRFIPNGVGSSTMHYQVFRNKNSTDEQFNLVNGIYKNIMTEDKDLCTGAQKNVNGGVFINGEMHPKMEQGPLYFQSSVRENVMAHHKREQAAKKEIWPARQVLPTTATVTQKDIDFCDSLTCSEKQPERQDSLVW